MPTVTRTEYLGVVGPEAGALEWPLACPAWEVRTLDAVYSRAKFRGSDQQVPYEQGLIPRRRWVDARRWTLPLIVFGDADPDGVPAPATALEQLRANVDELYRRLRPRQSTQAGTSTLRYHLADGSVRSGPVTCEDITLGFDGPHRLEGEVDLWLPKGLLRSETVDTVTVGPIADATPTDVVVPHSGTADDFAAVVTLSGTATAVTLTNKTWDPSLATKLDLAVDLSTGQVVIDCGEWTAIQGGVSVEGSLEHAGHERWLPLAPGDNTLEVVATGGTVTVQVDHYPPFL